ncbi:hypothetical protein Taro_031171 [Colocasia esculenta]|uniref:CCHC-type domain-containing protein n=1 Tax=Colocasia esculenta TaxID=4460 RepID=A0A843VN90_COLES|nr:hypothetical protein [Colocasia esculenta]
MRRGVSSRPQHPRVLRYFLHHHLWIMAYSCMAWLRLQLQFPRSIAMVARPSWRDEALSAAYRQESEMDQYIEEKRAAQKRSAPPFQRQDKKKAVVYQSPQHPVAPSQQAVVPQTLSFRPRDKKMCPHCGRAHDGTECWKLARKCLKCGSIEHQIQDCPRLQQFAQREAPAPAAAAAAVVAAPVTGRPERPQAQA